MSSRVLLLSAAPLLLLLSTATRAEPASNAESEVLSLCDVLHAIGSGEQRSVRVSGVFSSGFEHSVLMAPDCSWNVQPVTWVAFERETAGLEALFAKVERYGAVLITVTGTIYGPGRSDPGPRFAPEVRARIRLQRHGHLNSYRTKLVVANVEEITAPVPGAVLANVDSAPLWAPSGQETFPTVTRGQLPTYPPIARMNDMEGDVELELVIERGKVVDATVVSGEGLLADHARREATTWEFEPFISRRITTRFSYRLEERSPQSNQNPRVEMQLPERVTLVAPFYKW